MAKRKNMNADMGLVLGIVLTVLIIYVVVNPGAARFPSGDLSLPSFPKVMPTQPSVKIISPVEGEELTGSHDVTVKFEVKNWNVGNGNHVHIQIDGGCGDYEKSNLDCHLGQLNYLDIPQELRGPQIIYRSTDPVVLKLVPNGVHTVKVFLVDANHIPIGTNGEMDDVTFTVNVKSTVVSIYGGYA